MGISEVIDLLSLIINTILTISIFKITQNNSKNHQEYEKKINKKQLELQEKQQKIDIFPYRRNTCLNLFKVFQQVGILQRILNDNLLEKRNLEESLNILNDILKSNSFDVSEFFLSIKESKYIFPEHVYLAINEVNKEYDKLLATIKIHETLVKNLEDTLIENEKEDFVKNIKKHVNNIMMNADFLNNIVDEYMNIT